MTIVIPVWVVQLFTVLGWAGLGILVILGTFLLYVLVTWNSKGWWY
jgi:hypothetical protein